MSEQDDTASSVYENTNGMPMSNGKNLHMEIGPGEIANRVLTVGSLQRAEKISQYLSSKTIYTSQRGFTTISGYYNSQYVSIVSIGMGVSMMDFFVRESRAITNGPMVIVRFGTCGGLAEDAPAGCIVVAKQGSAYIARNPDAFTNDSDSLQSHSTSPYTIHRIAESNKQISELVMTNLEATFLDKYIIKDGLNITADSFYSSQGRIDPNFNDDNTDVINTVLSKYPDAKSMEMETFVLLHLANCSRKQPIYATAAAIVVANRLNANVLTGNILEELEDKGGKAILDALTLLEL